MSVCVHLCGYFDFGIAGSWWLSCQLGEGSNKIIVYKFLEALRNQTWIVIWGTVGKAGEEKKGKVIKIINTHILASIESY